MGEWRRVFFKARIRWRHCLQPQHCPPPPNPPTHPTPQPHTLQCIADLNQILSATQVYSNGYYLKGSSGPESFEWFIEDQAFSSSNNLAPSPTPSPVSKLALRLAVCYTGRANWRDGGGGWGRSQIVRLWESLVLYKYFNTLWSGDYNGRASVFGTGG